jgi:class 3 adenylate cyclase
MRAYICNSAQGRTPVSMSTVETDPPKAQRHLAAIIAADIVGYSGQMEKDEVGTLGRLRDLRQNLIEPKVAEHRGRVFKTTGDGFLAEFVSVLEAVHCAVDIQRLMAARNLDLPEAGRVQLRIGVNLGDVFHEGDDVFGDGVNIAARLESIAPPGGIYISRAACDPIRDRLAFDFEDLGEHQVKNIARPIHVFGVRIEGEPNDTTVKPPTRQRRALGGALIATLSALTIVVLVAALWWSGSFNSMTSRPVPPTANIPVQPPVLASPPTTPATVPPPPAPKVDAELLFWQSISSSNNAADFEEYLHKYPSGQFAGLARNRLAALTPRSQPTLPEEDPNVIWMYRIVGNANLDLRVLSQPTSGKLIGILPWATNDIQIDKCNGEWCLIKYGDGRVINGWVPRSTLARSQVCTDCGSE